MGELTIDAEQAASGLLLPTRTYKGLGLAMLV